jgi:two-component system, oxyanion-binding sensor
MTIDIRTGFMPLTDAALLIAAKEMGFAEDEGVALHLVRESSWANIRDRMAVGQFDIAHMLAPMPVAASLGLQPLSVPTIAPMALGLGGNAVTTSLELARQLADIGVTGSSSAAECGAALASVIALRNAAGAQALRFAVVHPFSGHNFELRYFLNASGIRPDADVEIVIVPPPLMPDALASGRIDGFCVGEPWNSAAVADGHGRVLTTKSAIWRSSPEKVLGVGAAFADANPETLDRIVRALAKASHWCARPENLESLSQMLAGEKYLRVPAGIILLGLSGRVKDSAIADPDFLIFEKKAATFPWISHALWFYSQMVAAGFVTHSTEAAGIAARSYRPDIYRRAVASLGVPLPSANSKVEGALQSETAVGATGAGLTLGPDGFFDGRIFDPGRLDDYIARQPPQN